MPSINASPASQDSCRAPASATTGDPPSHVRVEQVRLLYAQAVGGCVITLVSAALLVGLLWGAVGHAAALGWFALMACVTAGRYALVCAYRRASDTIEHTPRWCTRFVAGAAAAGTGWGLGAVLLFPGETILHQVFIAFVLGGMAAGAVPYLGPVMAAYLAFVLPALLPFGGVLLMQGDQAHALMGVLVLLFLGAMWGSARAVNATIARSLQLRFENRALNDDLLGTRADTERVKAELEAEIEQRRRTEAELHREKERAHITLESIGEGVITTRVDGTIEYMNPVAEQLTGWVNEEARGLALPKVFKLIDETTGQSVPNPVRRCLQEHAGFRLPGHTLLLHRNEDQDFSVAVAVSPIHDRERHHVGAVLVFHDVTEIRGIARRMSYQASHDSLTGLVNRQEFELRLTRALESARNEGRHHAVCYLDLDQFKVVNDTCGHIAGDELLKQLAAALQQGLRESDTLARLGGDEFGVLLEGCPVEKAKEIAEELRQLVQDFRFAWQDHVFEIGVSIGLVPVGSDGGSLTEVMSAADAACYVAKERGRDRIHVQQPDAKTLARRHGELQWAARIAQALEQSRIQLYRQCTMPLSAKARERGYSEILMRMHDENGLLVPTNAFLPAAKRYNLMPTIDRWVFRRFCAFITRPDALPAEDNDILAINLSGQSLSDESFLDFVVDQIQQHRVRPQRICFEITETAAIANLTRAIRFITVLKEMGANFALDDFGSGISSFAYLKNLKVDYLKIDGSFIRDTEDDPVDYAMIEIINQIGHVMDIRTIAESVEQERVLTKLMELGVDYAQGFTIARPMPLEPGAASSAEHKAANAFGTV